MESILKYKLMKYLKVVLFCGVIFGFFQITPQINAQETQTSKFVQFNGKIIDGKSKSPLEFAAVTLNNSNISTISNIDGEFSIKIPNDLLNGSITITYLGFKSKTIELKNFSSKNAIFRLEESVEKLPGVNLATKDPYSVINNLLKKRVSNYVDSPLIMKAFYRESIKKRRTYASLSEAVVDIYKFPYRAPNNDYVNLKRARKSTDYRKIDTLVIKLQGGPYNNLHMDMIKNRNLFFTEDVFDIYNFTFDKIINLNKNTVYVINFKQKTPIVEPFYQGKLYIDTNSFALIKAVFSLNLENLNKASKFFVKKKPARADVIPTRTNYIVEYRMKNGKWYFGYSRIELTFKIDWNKKLFNSLYHLTIEMATTDWNVNSDNKSVKNKDRLKSSVILNDKARGFSDPEYWGEYNIIEPDKSIENAINKIKRQLEKKG
jgi:carboxypeptidase-like protein